ncbi:MAG: hypothetical protein Q4C12_02845 [Clostridia bacterium]|nr:hypothetical protein [Clostridia bacterium]
MLGSIFGRVFQVLLRKPFLLWGLSLLGSLLASLAFVGFICVIPIGIGVSYTLTAGMSLVFLDGLRGKEVNSNQLFAGFKNFFHVAGGMAWMALWVLLWSLIPCVGIILGVYKAYSYRFTPYILITKPEISATDALKESIRMTYGYKGSMFAADLLLFAVPLFAFYIIALLASIPYIGILFAMLLIVAYIIYIVFISLASGLTQAAFYDTAEQNPISPIIGEQG